MSKPITPTNVTVRTVQISLPPNLQVELTERGKITLSAGGIWYTLQSIIEELLLAWIHHFGAPAAAEVLEEVDDATE